MGKRKRDATGKEEYSSSISYTIKDVFGIKPRIELSGNTSVTVDGCKGVLEYSKTQIRISLGDCSLQLQGRGLDLRYISPTTLVIDGFICSLEYIM